MTKNDQTVRNQDKAYLLKQAYGSSGQSRIAYIDESYLDNDNAAAGENPLYIVASVVLNRGDVATMNKQLSAIVPSGHWHTTLDVRTSKGQRQFEQIIAQLTNGFDPVVVSHKAGQSGVNFNKEKARHACLVQLASHLANDYGVGLLVLEERSKKFERDIDRITIAKAKKSGVLPRGFVLHQTSPKFENLLWLPDVVSNSTFRDMRGLYDARYQPLKSSIDFIEC